MTSPAVRDPRAPLPEVEVLRAPNPGPLTLSGTNAHVIRDGGAAWIVDPGPRDPAHLAALLAASGVDRGLSPLGVLVTHRHADHTEAAGTLRRQLENRCGHDVPLWAQDLDAVPGARPLPAELLGPWGVAAHVIHLPGHTSDSVGLLVEGGRLLTGDAVLGGSSTVIAPPDGDLTEHLQSLRILRAMCQDGRIAEILPGHGERIEGPAAAEAEIRAQIAHREERIEQVREARAAGALTLPRLLRAVYGPDLAPELREGAEWNLRACLRHLGAGA